MINVVGYEGLYLVNELGFVFSLNYNKFLKPINHSAGYSTVALSKNGVQKKIFIHRIVATAFLGESKLHVNHKDGNKKNNNLSNLEYVTPKENVAHAIKTKLMKIHGENNPSSKLTDQQVINIRNEYIPRKNSLGKLAKKYKVSRQTIYDVIKNKCWRQK